MPAALPAQGRTALRDAWKTLVTHIGLSTDATAFSDDQTALNPSGAGTNLIKASTETNVDGNTFDSTVVVNGTTEFTGLTIRTIAMMFGGTRVDLLARHVRGAGIGIEAGDLATIGLRGQVIDQS